MPVKLKVTNRTEPTSEQEILFHDDVITIGRDSSNLLQLPDTERKLVSRKHAKVERRGEIFQLIDLYSRNSTYLNDEKLDGGRPYILHDGDRFKIGDFIVQFFALLEDGDVDKPKPRVDFANPFIDESNELAQIITRIYEKYVHANPDRRRENLRQALQWPLQQIKKSDAAEVIASVLAGLHRNGDIESDIEKEQKSEELALQLEDAYDEIDRLRDIISSRISEQGSGVEALPVDAKSQQSRLLARLNQTVDILLQSVVKLIAGLWNFRTEFIGTTIIQSAKSLPLQCSTKEELKRYLLDLEISEDEIGNRQAILKRTADELMLHQIALLDGYRSSVEEGRRKLLQMSDPEVLKQELAERKLKLGPIQIPYRFLPIFSTWQLLQLYRRKHHQLKSEDRGVLEKKIFRPGFIQGYEGCVAAVSKDLSSKKTQ